MKKYIFCPCRVRAPVWALVSLLLVLVWSVQCKELVDVKLAAALELMVDRLGKGMT